MMTDSESYNLMGVFLEQAGKQAASRASDWEAVEQERGTSDGRYPTGYRSFFLLTWPFLNAIC
jgi:hypothetical protein